MRNRRPAASSGVSVQKSVGKSVGKSVVEKSVNRRTDMPGMRREIDARLKPVG
jgi:hypothetical protein